MSTSRRAFLATGAAAALASQLAAGRSSRSSALTLAADIASGRLSAVEATEDRIARIEKLDGSINAVVVRDFDRARQAAREADRALARGDRRPLLGVPMTVKESFDVAGLPTTWGIPGLNVRPAVADADAVARLKSAGAVILGKTNVPFQTGLFHGARVPLLLHDWQTYNPIFGTTLNPWNTARTPGGSSGGAAAALASGFVALELGSDVGGSIRAPAHFCGVYGHKPTSGLVSQRGHVPPIVSGPPRHPELFDMPVCGPMATSAQDLEIALRVLASGPVSLSRDRRPKKLGDFHVFVLDTHPLMPVSTEVRKLLDERARALSTAGAQVHRKSELLPDLGVSARLYMRALSAFDAMNWSADVLRVLADAATELSASDDSLAAERLRGAVLDDAGVADVLSKRRRLQAAWKRFFSEFDVLMCPIMPTTAFPHDHSPDEEARRIIIAGKPAAYMDQLFWPGIATFAGLPATTCPLGLASDGLPVGVQVIGPFGGDGVTIGFARLMEQHFGKPPAAPFRSS